jgi:aspartokinase/homoserine dehydrogenase 1
MNVLKFGGSSVASPQSVDEVLAIVKKSVQKRPSVVVVSAMGGITDMLLMAGRLATVRSDEYKQIIAEIENRFLDYVRKMLPVATQSSTLSMVKQQINSIEDICSSIYILEEMSPRITDKLLSFGELITSSILADKMQAEGMEHCWIDSRELIKTNSKFGYATVSFGITNKLIRQRIDANAYNLYLLPGFIASDEFGNTTTLGRGGSDYTAAIVAAALNAKRIEIWTDVSGMMTADPKQVKNAKPIESISYQEAMELSHFGAKVLYPPTVQPVLRKKIPLWIKNTFAPADHGTLIAENGTDRNQKISGLSSIGNVALLSLEGAGMVGIPGFSKRLFAALASESVNVILITQGSSEHSICVAISENDEYKAANAVNQAFHSEIADGAVYPIKSEKGYSVVALVGNSMVNHPGISGRMFGALGRNGINVRAIAQGSSERNISTVVSAKDLKKALNVLHESFFETSYKQINLFIVGAGNVGSRLLEQLKQQQSYLQDHLKLQVRAIGIANSRTMVFNEDGIDLSSWELKLQEGVAMNLDKFIEQAVLLNKRNSIFIDNTANVAVAETYKHLLRKSISVVTCNKIACSSAYSNYKELKELARNFNAQFLFETNVGAGLPVINTLNDLLRSGDRISTIQAVLSGTLNFVFNKYDGSQPFASIVRQAQTEGYTEPDPRLDLSGTDVMRKILILARETGKPMEIDQIKNVGFLPESCLEGDIENFYKEVEKHENHFKTLLEKAKAEGKRLKYIAMFKEGKASVGLQAVSSTSDFYNLDGKDNAVLFYTDRYKEQPLVVKGAGAGAEVTASGIFSDIIRAARV